MNYDTIIVEMLSRIQALEDRVQALSQRVERGIQQQTALPQRPPQQRMRTSDIRSYIQAKKRAAAAQAQPFLTLKAGDIHRGNQLKNAMPMVCNAMRQCMQPGDQVLHETPSGYSSTLEIRYRLTEQDRER